MNIKDFKDSLDYLFRAQVTPFLWGHPGIGKSSIIKQYAKDNGYHFFAFYLGTQSDLGDILGLADFVRDANGTAIATTFAIPEWLRNTIKYCEENPASGAIIFLDEFNRARKDILSGMFSLALDKTFHTLKLPKNCYIIAAGNPPTEEYQVTDVDDTALMARFAHIKLEPSFEEWVQYAEDTQINPSIVNFLKSQPDLLEDKRSVFDLPVKVDRRSYTRMNDLFKAQTPMHLMEQLLPGIIGFVGTIAYMKHLKEQDIPLTGEQVLSKISFNKIEKWSDSKDIKASLLNLTCENVETYLIKLNESIKELTPIQKSNLMTFFHVVPKDMSFTIIDKLVSKKLNLFENFYLDPLYEQQMYELIIKAKGVKK